VLIAMLKGYDLEYWTNKGGANSEGEPEPRVIVVEDDHELEPGTPPEREKSVPGGGDGATGTSTGAAPDGNTDESAGAE